MKKMNKSLLMMVLVALMAFVCAFVSLGFVNSGVSASADDLARPTTSTTAAADKFYVVSGARVRVTESQSGIAFGSIVTKEFHNSVTKNGTVEVEYFATAQVAGGANWSALRFPIQPSFAGDATTFELRTYINFNSLDDNDEAYRKAAYARDFAIETYVKAGDTYFKAADEENGINRSMQAVANAASLKWTNEEVDGFAKEDVAKYFTVGERSEKVSAYAFDDNSGYVTLPGVDGTKNAKVEMYAGAKSLGEFTYDADKGTYAGTLPETGYVSAFVDGKVYSTVAADAIKITDAEGMKQLQTTTNSNVYVIDADIDMSSITEWTANGSNADTAFKGVLDGMQHSLTNYTVRGGGLFAWTSGATIKNLHVEVKDYANTSRYSGVLIQRCHNSWLENIYVDVLSENQTSSNTAAALVGITTSGGTTTFKDCVVVVRSKTAAPRAYNGDGDALFNTRAEGNMNFVNSYGLNGTNYKLPVVGYSYGDYHTLNGKKVDEATVYDAIVSEDIVDFDSSVLANDFLKACYANTKDALGIIELTRDNIQEKLMGATSGYFVLTDDIDMSSMTWEPTGASFTGVINGKGHSIRNFTSPSGNGYMGLLPNVSGVTIKNLNMHIVTNGNRAALTGQVKGSLLVENCVFDVDTLTNAVTSGVIANVVQGTVTVNNVIINIDNAGTSGGIVAGNQSSSHNVIVSNSYFASKTLTNVFAGDNCDNVALKETTLGTDGALAVAGEDYKLYTSLTALGDAIFAGEIPADLAESAKDLGLVTAVSNFEELEAVRTTATTGYFYLTADIDMAGITASTIATNHTFSGTFNGNDHIISNFTTGVGQWGCLFGKLAGTVKNVAFTNATVSNSISGVIARGLQDGAVVENVYIHAKSVSDSAGAIAGVTDATNSADPDATLKNVTVVIDAGGQSFINGGAYGNGTIKVENCYFVSNKTLPVLHLNANSDGVITTTEDTDYFRYSSKAAFAGDVLASKTTITDFAKSVFLKTQTTAISQENIADLQNITTGYIYLSEDIDMAKFTEWAPVDGFAATLDGNGYTISNFSSPTTAYKGLVGNTAAGATFINLTIHAVTNANRAMLTGQIKGATTVTNCKFIVDKLAGGNAGVIANVVQGDVTVSDTYIVVIGADASQAKVGIVAGGEACSHNVIVSDVYAFSANGYITEMYKGFDVAGNHTGSTLGTDGALAVAGEDYVLYANGAELATAYENRTINADFEAWLTENGFIKAISAANAAEMSKGGTVGGYWYLTEDVDMATVDFNGEEEGLGTYVGGSFWGIFDGKNNVISNSTTSLFGDTYVTTIKNLIVKCSVTASNVGGLVTSVRSSATVVENVVIDIEKLNGYASGGIAKTLAGTGMVIRNTLVIVNDSADQNQNGILIGGRYDASFTATVENVYVLDKATAENKVDRLTGLGTDNATAYTKLSADPVVVNAASELEVATMPTALVDLISIYDVSFFG